MPRFHFNLHDGSQVLFDEEGKECRDVVEAREFALKSARAIVSSDALNGLVDLEGRIEIVDGGGNCLSIVSFHEAVRLKPPS